MFSLPTSNTGREKEDGKTLPYMKGEIQLDKIQRDGPPGSYTGWR